MGLSRSTFYASQKTTPAQIKTDELAEKISEVQNSCFFTIGRRRMGAVLHKRYGIEVCETTLQRIMSRRGLTARIRQVRKADMIHNDLQPNITVDAQTYEVRIDGELITSEPANVLPMAQRYFLF